MREDCCLHIEKPPYALARLLSEITRLGTKIGLHIPAEM